MRTGSCSPNRSARSSGCGPGAETAMADDAAGRNRAPWRDVYDFWFLPQTDPAHGQARPEWFRKDAAFDATIRDRFGPVIERALAGDFHDWDADPRGALARIVVLDQFTRNVFRDTPRAFAGDARAQQAAVGMIESGADRLLAPVERWFAYMPLEHAEDLALQERSVGLFSALAKD